MASMLAKIAGYERAFNDPNSIDHKSFQFPQPNFAKAGFFHNSDNPYIASAETLMCGNQKGDKIKSEILPDEQQTDTEETTKFG